jgi:hypothetical protein
MNLGQEYRDGGCHKDAGDYYKSAARAYKKLGDTKSNEVYQRQHKNIMTRESMITQNTITKKQLEFIKSLVVLPPKH